MFWMAASPTRKFDHIACSTNMPAAGAASCSAEPFGAGYTEIAHAAQSFEWTQFNRYLSFHFSGLNFKNPAARFKTGLARSRNRLPGSDPASPHSRAALTHLNRSLSDSNQAWRFQNAGRRSNRGSPRSSPASPGSKLGLPRSNRQSPISNRAFRFHLSSSSGKRKAAGFIFKVKIRKPTFADRDTTSRLRALPSRCPHKQHWRNRRLRYWPDRL